MFWTTSPLESASSGGVDFSTLTELNTASNDDELLIYDVSTANNYKITVSNLVNLSPLVASISALSLVGNEMIYAVNSTTFTSTPTQTYGRSLLTATNIASGRSLLGLVIGTDVQEWNSNLDAFSTSANSASNNDIFYYDSGAFSRITLSNYVRDTLLLTASSSALASSLSAVTYSVDSVDNTIPRWDGTSNLLQNSGISISDSDDLTGINSINTSVTSSVLTQVGNIGANTISGTIWGYVASLDQDVSTSSGPTFDTLNVTNTSSFNGALNMNSNKILGVSDPTSSTDAANKNYVDTAVGSGAFEVLASARMASTANVAYTYNNTGGSNSRGSLTAPANGVGVIDGITLVANDRILISDQTTALQNGVYIVQDIGTAGTPYVLERAADFYSGVAPVSNNSLIYIEEGDIHTGDRYVLTATVTTFGTDPVNFVQYSSQAGAGAGLELVAGVYNVLTPGGSGNIYINGSNQVDINGTLNIAKGGTNASSFTTDRVVYYDGSSLASTSLDPDTIATTANTLSLTNKTLDDSTNTISADALWDKNGTKITITNSASAAKQLLTTLTSSTASWQASYDALDINGATAKTTVEDADEVIIYDSTAGVNKKMTKANFVANIPAVLPAGVIRVAKSGGDYTTIAAGLAAASAGDVVVVYPGNYAESITIPNGIRLSGVPNALNTVISGADTTSTRVIFSSNGGTLREITVYSPSSGSNPAVDATGLATGQLAVIFNVTIIGQGAGAGFEGAGSGIMALLTVYHVAGTLTGSFIDASGGTLIGHTMIANGGACVDFINHSGTGFCLFNDITISSADVYSATTMLNLSSTGNFELNGAIVDDDSPFTNGVRISGENVNVSLTSVHLHTTSSGFDILVDSDLVGTNSTVSISGEVLREKLSILAGYKIACLVFLIHGIDHGIENDAAIFVDGELTVGAVDNPSELAVGEGDSSVNNMLVYSESTGGVFTSHTTAAKSRTGSIFSFFDGTASGNIAYIGNSVRTFSNIRVDVTTAQVLGSGSVIWEYWNGSWTSFNVMETLATSPYTQNGNILFTTTNAVQIRFNDTILDDWAVTTVGGEIPSAYYIRCRIVTAITTVPQMERIKIGTNRTEINGDGFIEYFGTGQPTERVSMTPWYSTLGSPVDATFNISSGISNLIIPNAECKNGQNEGLSYIYILRKGIDTSRDIPVEVRWIGVSGTGTVALTLTYVKSIDNGDNINNGSLSQTATTITTNNPTANLLQTTTFTISIPDDTPGDTWIFQVSRNATGGTSPTGDTYTGSIRIFNASIIFTHWTR